MSINKVILVGNLGADPDLRKTPSDLPVCGFSIATDYIKRNGEGESEKETFWHNIVCFGSIAENAGKYLKKGRQVYLEGTLVPNTWEDGDGTKHAGVKIVAQTIEFLGSAQKPEASEPTPATKKSSSRSTSQEAAV